MIFKFPRIIPRILNPPWLEEWTDWFAWYPIQLCLVLGKPSGQWAWLEVIQRYCLSTPYGVIFYYRKK